MQPFYPGLVNSEELDEGENLVRTSQRAGLWMLAAALLASMEFSYAIPRLSLCLGVKWGCLSLQPVVEEISGGVVGFQPARVGEEVVNLVRKDQGLKLHPLLA